MTAEKYIPDLFTNDPEARLYRTGDQARYRADGNIEFLGRIDQQIKLRGFRIELGEIEVSLNKQDTVDQAVVIVREDSPGDQRLVAYLKAAGRASIEADSLRKALRVNLPDYMIPAAFVVLAEIPLTPNGKIDRKALPAPEWTAQGSYVAPRSIAEEALCELWAATLGVEQVGVHDDFFDLGGHSLLIMKLIRQIQLATGEQITIADIFENPTISEFSHLLEGVAWKQIEFKKPGILLRLWRYLSGK